MSKDDFRFEMDAKYDYLEKIKVVEVVERTENPLT